MCSIVGWVFASFWAMSYRSDKKMNKILKEASKANAGGEK